MTRVALVNLASLPMPGNEPIYPIGLQCVREALDRAGHETRLIDFVENPADFSDLTWAMESWDVIGFSIRNIDPIDLTRDGFVDEYARFIDRVRTATATTRPIMVCGGPGYSLFGQTLLSRLKLDAGVVGPGETAMLDICANPEGYRSSGRNLMGERYGGFTTERLHHPQGLMESYTQFSGAMIGVETRRKTCYQECVYCPYAHIAGDNSGDLKPPELIADEVQSIYDAGIRRVFFTDSIFNAEIRYAKSVVRTIAGMNLPDLTWSAYFTPKPFDDEFAELLKSSNIEQIIVSPDSLDLRMMKALGKRFDTRHITRMVERSRRHELQLRVIVVFGGPGEDRESVRASAEYANSTFESGELLIHIGYRILPATALARQVGMPDDNLLDPTFYPFDPDIFNWVMEDFDGRFFTTKDILHLMAARHSTKQMARVPQTEGTDASSSPTYLAITRHRSAG